MAHDMAFTKHDLHNDDVDEEATYNRSIIKKKKTSVCAKVVQIVIFLSVLVGLGVGSYFLYRHFVQGADKKSQPAKPAPANNTDAAIARANQDMAQYYTRVQGQGVAIPKVPITGEEPAKEAVTGEEPSEKGVVNPPYPLTDKPDAAPKEVQMWAYHELAGQEGLLTPAKVKEFLTGTERTAGSAMVGDVYLDYMRNAVPSVYMCFIKWALKEWEWFDDSSCHKTMLDEMAAGKMSVDALGNWVISSSTVYKTGPKVDMEALKKASGLTLPTLPKASDPKSHKPKPLLITSTEEPLEAIHEIIDAPKDQEEADSEQWEILRTSDQQRHAQDQQYGQQYGWSHDERYGAHDEEDAQDEGQYARDGPHFVRSSSHSHGMPHSDYTAQAYGRDSVYHPSHDQGYGQQYRQDRPSVRDSRQRDTDYLRREDSYYPHRDSQYPRHDSQYTRRDSEYHPRHDSEYHPRHDSEYYPRHDSEYYPRHDSEYYPHHDSQDHPSHADEGDYHSQRDSAYLGQHSDSFGAGRSDGRLDRNWYGGRRLLGADFEEVDIKLVFHVMYYYCGKDLKPPAEATTKNDTATPQHDDDPLADLATTEPKYSCPGLASRETDDAITSLIESLNTIYASSKVKFSLAKAIHRNEQFWTLPDAATWQKWGNDEESAAKWGALNWETSKYVNVYVAGSALAGAADAPVENSKALAGSDQHTVALDVKEHVSVPFDVVDPYGYNRVLASGLNPGAAILAKALAFYLGLPPTYYLPEGQTDACKKDAPGDGVSDTTPENPSAYTPRLAHDYLRYCTEEEYFEPAEGTCKGSKDNLYSYAGMGPVYCRTYFTDGQKQLLWYSIAAKHKELYECTKKGSTAKCYELLDSLKP